MNSLFVVLKSQNHHQNFMVFNGSTQFNSSSTPMVFAAPPIPSPSDHVLGSFHCLTALKALLQGEAVAVASLGELAMTWKAKVEISATAPKMWKTMG